MFLFIKGTVKHSVSWMWKRKQVSPCYILIMCSISARHFNVKMFLFLYWHLQTRLCFCFLNVQSNINMFLFFEYRNANTFYLRRFQPVSFKRKHVSVFALTLPNNTVFLFLNSPVKLKRVSVSWLWKRKHVSPRKMSRILHIIFLIMVSSIPFILIIISFLMDW